MSKKGRVRRLDSFSNDNSPLSPVARHYRSQDHLDRFIRLIGMELEDETAQIEARWKTWNKERLIRSGYALFDLNAKKSGTFFDEQIITLSGRDRGRLPSHGLGQGDRVVLSRSRPWAEKTTEGVVLDRGPTRIRIVVKEAPSDLKKGGWRIDRGANRVAHDRMQEALFTFHSTEGEGGTVLRDLLLCNTHDPAFSATLPPELKGKGKGRPNPRLDKLSLDSSQMEAVENAINSRLTLIQGPPGTGKTHTAVQLLKALVEMGRGPILATAESNVAVDNLLEGLLDNGVRAVRIGRPVKVREQLRAATLDAQMELHPDQGEIEFIREETQAMRAGLHDLKGKEKGMAHRDISRNMKEIKSIQKKIIDDTLDRAEIICSTNIGTGHLLLGTRRFPIVLIDEATQASEPSALVPIVRGARQLIMVGDHRQLPPTVISRDAEEGGLNISLFERLIANGLSTTMLTTQYRMHPVIREFPSARFYDNRLSDGCSREERPPAAGFIWPDWDKPVAFIPVRGSESTEQDGSSKTNIDEAAMVIQVLDGLLATADLRTEDIGIISPYSGQVRMIEELIIQSSNDYDGLEVKTVDGYQGREKEIIIISTVRSNEEGKVGFLSDTRRLNVAITRARCGLIVIGDETTLRRDKNWRAWLDWISESGLMAWHMVR